jgi:outer membrane lipoprotein-sorting protein
MKTRLHLAPIILLVATLFLLGGCGGDKKAADKPAAPAASTPAKPAPAAEETIAAIMMKAKNAPGVSYDMVMTAPGFSNTSRLWSNKDKMRVENTFEGKKMITIVDGDITYMYNPEENVAMKFSGKNLPAGMEGKPEHPSDYQDNMVKDSLKSLETVVYEGVKCRVITFVDKEDGATAKMWLREDYGLPMKQEVVSKKGEKMTIEFKNMKIGAQSADLFKLPAGVKIQDMNEIMKNMPKNKS